MDTVDHIYALQASLHDALLLRGLVSLLSAREKQVLLLRLDDWEYCEIAERLKY
jgi:hypothetical protein